MQCPLEGVGELIRDVKPGSETAIRNCSGILILSKDAANYDVRYDGFASRP